MSIGSLYQYFPDKLSLVDAIRNRHLNDSMTAMRSLPAGEITPADFSVRLVEAVVAAHSVHPGLHRVLLDEAPSSEEYRNPESKFETEYLSYYANAIAAYGKRSPNAADQIAGRVLSDAVDGVIHNAARRGAIHDQAMHKELVRLITLYLDATAQELGDR